MDATFTGSESQARSKFAIQIDLNVLNHLGMSLYSNTPAVLTEIISNAWDADANNVEITIDSSSQEVVIVDDGHGMSAEDIEEKFLKVGYARRSQGRAQSDKLERQVMGRKGIGKLAMFSLANKIHVISHKEGFSPQGFEVDVSALQKSIESGDVYEARKINVSKDIPLGTSIKLFDLNKSINKTEGYLRKRLARRFSVIGDGNDFSVKINNSPITTSDRDFLSDIQFLWELDHSDSKRVSSCSNLIENDVIDSCVSYDGVEYKLSGYIGSVSKPSQLTKDSEISNNSITVISNGRVFEENILLEFGSAKVFTSYLVGEVVADFVDANELPDMATSSRQQLQQNDPRYAVLKSYLEGVLKNIDKKWDEWRRSLGVEEAKKESPVLQSWLDKLKKQERTSAEKLIGKVNTIRFSGGDDQQREAKKSVLKNTVLAFEKLRIMDNLDSLDKISNLASENFKEVFSSIDDIESSLFYDITSQRLKVIDKFKKITDNDELEKVVQSYLYDHLWLLDPSWERVTGSSVIEQTLTKELRQADPTTDSGARIDIAFKTVSGRHVIIEMKRPSVTPKLRDLVDQGHRYVTAVNQWYRNNPKSCDPNGKPPTIEVILLVGKGYEEDYPGYISGQLSSINGSLLTYNDLITQSLQAYKEYHDKRVEASDLKKLVESI